MTTDDIHEPIMAVATDAHFSLTDKLGHGAALRQKFYEVGSHVAPNASIVGAYVGCIVGRSYSAIGQYHGDALLQGSLYSWSKGFRLVGDDHEEVYARLDEGIDLTDLLGIVVVSTTNVELHVFIEVGLAAHLVIHLVVPNVVTALRHSDMVFLIAFAACAETCSEE